VSHKIFEILQTLDAARLDYRLSRHRDDTVLVTVTTVGERLEIDVFADGHVEFCRFQGAEQVSSDEVELARWLEQQSN
jgi:hypothetical protein